MKEYKSLILDNYITQTFLDKELKELSEQGWQLIPTCFKSNILIFERTKP